MAKKRTQPYGYQIACGKVTISPHEAETIRRIYRQYAAGLSYKRIAEELTESGVRYMPEKPTWNKNMIARILQNKSYVGENLYPTIIEVAEQQSAELAQKPYTHTESQDIKVLKPLLVCAHCNEPIRRRLKTAGGERWYCPADISHISAALTDELLLQGTKALLNQLMEQPTLARSHSTKNKKIDLATIRLQNEVDLALSASEPNLAEIQQSILTLATQKYALAQDTDDGGEELENELRQLAGVKFNSKRLKHITAQIKVEHTRVTALVLINGQTIQLHKDEKGEQDHV